ncbi:hypothetical protein C8R45DRAFT_923784 [Mycena sanguinolenta]|nr:hypothetical protein C8R45DRAFT_923784 [Mycena sanguinolenta]
MFCVAIAVLGILAKYPVPDPSPNASPRIARIRKDKSPLQFQFFTRWWSGTARRALTKPAVEKQTADRSNACKPRRTDEEKDGCLTRRRDEDEKGLAVGGDAAGYQKMQGENDGDCGERHGLLDDGVEFRGCGSGAAGKVGGGGGDAAAVVVAGEGEARTALPSSSSIDPAGHRGAAPETRSTRSLRAAQIRKHNIDDMKRMCESWQRGTRTSRGELQVCDEPREGRARRMQVNRS